MDKYKLIADSNNIILQERNVITGTGKGIRPTKRQIGEEYWNNIAYFITPHGALNYIIEKEIRESWVCDLKEVVKGMDKLYKAIQGIKQECLPQSPQ